MTRAGRTEEKCFACGRSFRLNGYGVVVYHPWALTLDGQRIQVGHDCYKKIVRAGEAGYQPPLGGPKLWDEYQAPPEALKAAGITITKGGRA